MARYTAEQEDADIARVIELTEQMRVHRDELRKMGADRVNLIERILTRGTLSLREIARRCGVQPSAINQTRGFHRG